MSGVRMSRRRVVPWQARQGQLLTALTDQTLNSQVQHHHHHYLCHLHAYYMLQLTLNCEKVVAEILDDSCELRNVRDLTYFTCFHFAEICQVDGW